MTPADTRSSRDDDRLVTALAGRTAAPGQTCVNVHDLRGHRLFPKAEAILFEGRGTTLYLNRPRGGCSGLRDTSLRTSTPTGRLCEGDIVQLFDRVSGTGHGACSLGPFIPYVRQRQ